MLKVIQADGVKLGQSEKFSPRQLKDKARAITTDAQNGVMVWTEANAELSEMSGGGGGVRYLQQSIVPGRIRADA